MPISPLVELNELDGAALCSYIEEKHYMPIGHSLTMLVELLGKLQQSSSDAPKVELLGLLFNRLKEEAEQAIRNDTLIIFPVIKNVEGDKPCAARKLPVEMMRLSHKKIMSLLEKQRQLAHNYICKPEWSVDFRMFCEALYGFEQHLQQAVFIKENVLLPKIENLFNQKCSGKCSH